MCSTDYLKPFVDVGRLLCEGADRDYIMNTIVGKIAETLGLKGCFVKMKDPVTKRIELLAGFSLSERFLRFEETPSSVCSGLPEKTICVARIEDSELNFEKEQMSKEGIQAFAVLPIEVEREVIAMVALFSGTPREFTDAELSFAEALADRGVLHIVWKRRMDALIDHERMYLRSFQEISSAINTSLNVSKVLELIVTKVTEALSIKGCVVRLLDPKTQDLYVAQSYGLSREFIAKGPVDAQRSIAENMAGRTVVIDDILTDPRLQYHAAHAEEGIRKILSIPLMVRGKFIGSLRIFTGERERFTEREINFATSIAQQCAFAIENARMYQRLQHEYQQILIDFGYDGSSN